MAFADPQSVTIGGTASSLPRTGQGLSSGTFTKDDRSIVLTVSNQTGKRRRTTARIDTTKIAADPLMASINVRLSSSVYVVVDAPLQGFTNQELADQLVGLATWLTASTSANAKKMLGGEI